jgi:hypothetical protein
MSQKIINAFATIKAKQQQHHIGKMIQTSIFGRLVDGKIIAVYPFGTVDIETPSGCYRVSGLSLSTKKGVSA